MQNATLALITALSGLWLVIALFLLAASLYLLYRFVGMMDDVRFIAQSLQKRYGGDYKRTPVAVVFAVIAVFLAVAFLCVYMSSVAPSMLSSAITSTF